MALTIVARRETWPIAGSFTISRDARTAAEVVVATISDGRYSAEGECVPYARYGETVEGVLGTIAALDGRIATREALQRTLPPGAARNAVDCALWQLEAERAGQSLAAHVGISAPRPRLTCFTLSLDTPEAMARKAIEARDMPLLKVKLGGENDAARMQAVRAARPDARLVADANEGWLPRDVERLLAVAKAAGFELIEQPLPAADDGLLAGMERAVPVCADESSHVTEGLAALCSRYDAVNIKLDKTGGLTEALKMRAAARALGLKVMVGCMVATSLSMRPAYLLAQDADWADIDGPLLLARDRADGLVYARGMATLA